MSHRIHHVEPGTCTCLLGDPQAGSLPVGVRMISAGGALLETTGELRVNQFVYATVKLRDGPSLSLAGTVVDIEEGRPLLQWSHASRTDVDKLSSVLEEQLSDTSHAVAAASPVAETSPEGETQTAAARPAPARRLSAGADARARRARAYGTKSTKAPGTASTPEPATSAHPQPASVPKQPESAPASPAPEAAMAPAATAEPAERAERSDRKAASSASRPSPQAGQEPASGVDLDSCLRSRARTVRSADLASRLQTVQVLDLRTIKEFVKESVDEAVARLGQSFRDAERSRLLSEAESGLREKLRLYEAERAGLEERGQLLQDELTRARSLLDEEKKKAISAYQFTVSDAGIVELEQRLGRILDRSVRTGQAGQQLEDELRHVVARLLDDEREKIREQAREAQSEAIAILEKKVHRLVGSLESAEKERDLARRRAEVLEASGGVPLRNVLSSDLDDDPSKERKLALLKEIFEFNQEIRKQLGEHGFQKLGAKAQTEASPSSVSASPAEAIGRVSLPDPEEEASIARSLGIKVRATPVGDSEVAGPTVPQEDAGDESGAKCAEVARVAVPSGGLAGADGDPDDLPWEPSSDLEGAVSRWQKFRSH